MTWMNQGGSVYRASVWIYHITIMSVLLVLASVPIVTLPAATAALFGLARTQVRGEPWEPVRVFRRLFAENFWQASILGWMLILLGVGLELDGRVLVYSLHFSGGWVVLIWVFKSAFLALALYVFPVMVHLRVPWSRLVITSLHLTLYQFSWTVINGVAVVVLFIVTSRNPLGFLLLFPGLTVWITTRIAHRKLRSLTQMVEHLREQNTVSGSDRRQ